MRFAIARLLVAVMLGIILLVAVFFVFPPVSFWRSSLLYAMWFGFLAHGHRADRASRACSAASG